MVALLLAIGVFAVYWVNKPSNTASDNVDSSGSLNKLIECPQTAEAYLEKADLVDIKTVTQIGLINYDKEVLLSQNKKNLVPPVNKPLFVNYDTLNGCFEDGRQVVVVQVADEVRLYPVAILEYHIVVNDVIAGEPIAVVYAPISGIVRAFKTTIKTDKLVFGHSGNLYKNTDLLVDFKTDSLWSVQNGKALIGVMSGGILEQIDYKVMNYAKAKNDYPQAKIMSMVTGYRRTYGIDPFIDYKTSLSIFQEPTNKSSNLADKDLILGFNYQGVNYAIAQKKVMQSQIYRTKIATDVDVKIVYDQGQFTLYVGKGSDSETKFDLMYWYVWYDYNPDTHVI